MGLIIDLIDATYYNEW